MGGRTCSDRLGFRRFIGEANPIAVAIGVGALGASLLSVLVVRDGFLIAGQRVGRGVSRSAGLATVFGAVIILVDLTMVHPADMNVPFPGSLLFYPVIGFIVEILFHLLTLCLLLTVFPPRVTRSRSRSEATVWWSLILVALLEPAFQVWTAASGTPVVGSPHAYASWEVAYDGLHVLAINLCQLVVFKRYDFVAMYAFRLVYYLIWHIAWGHVRLELLF